MHLAESLSHAPSSMPSMTHAEGSAQTAPALLVNYQIIRRNGAVVPFEPAKIAVVDPADL